jgi:hypothetical protein
MRLLLGLPFNTLIIARRGEPIMALRNGTGIGALLLVFGFSQIATAQDNPAPEAPALAAPQNGNPLDAVADETQASPNLDWRNVLKEIQLLRGDVHALQANVNGLQQNMNAVQDGFAKQMDINDKLQKQLNELSNRVEILAVGGADSNPVSTSFVRSIQDDPKLASDFQKVIQGKVIFDNQTGESQRIFVNGAEWEVITGRSSMLVPYGRVTFHTHATNDGGLTQFNVDNWTQQGEQFVLNVPLQETPRADR